MNKKDKYEKEKMKKRKEKEEKKEKEKEKKREAYLKEKEEEIRNRIINIDYKKKKEKKKEKEKEKEKEEEEEEEENEYEEEEEEERSNKRKGKNKSVEKDKYDKHIEKDYLGNKGITKRTIGVGRINVKVYENDEDDSWLEDVVKKEKKEYKKKEITQNKNTEDKYITNNEIKNINYNNNHNNNYNININYNNNNSEEKDSIVFNIDGRNFLIKALYHYSNSSEDGEIINVKFFTTSPGSKVVHWGLYKANSPKIWILPPKSSYPNFTKEVNNKALETKFPNSQVNGQREISFVLPRKMDGGYIGGIYFAIYDPIKNLWYNNFKKNFNLVFN